MSFSSVALETKYSSVCCLNGVIFWLGVSESSDIHGGC